MKKVLFYSVFIIICVLLWMTVIFIYVFSGKDLQYWPFILLLVFVYPALYSLLKRFILGQMS